MDIFITIISWLGGLTSGFILIIFIILSLTSHGSETNIVSFLSSILFLWLLWIGASSLYNYVIPDTPSNTQVIHVKETKKEPIMITTNSNEFEYVYKGLYILAVLSFFAWLFIPSKDEQSSRTLLRNKFIKTVSLKANDKVLKTSDTKGKADKTKHNT